MKNGPIVKRYYEPMAWARSGFDSPWVHHQTKNPAEAGVLGFLSLQKFFAADETEEGSGFVVNSRTLYLYTGRLDIFE